MTIKVYHKTLEIRKKLISTYWDEASLGQVEAYSIVLSILEQAIHHNLGSVHARLASEKIRQKESFSTWLKGIRDSEIEQNRESILRWLPSSIEDELKFVRKALDAKTELPHFPPEYAEYIEAMIGVFNETVLEIEYMKGEQNKSR